MDRSILENLLNNPENEVRKTSKEELHELLIAAIEYANEMDNGPKGHRQLIIATEELSELIKEVTKELRGKGSKLGITEEISDVLLYIEYIKIICDIKDEDISKILDIKVERLRTKLHDKTYG